MKFSAERESILAPLQAVIGVVERRQTMPILANVLITGRGEQLSITATDLEVELVAKANVTLQQAGEITLPGRKLLDIVKALPDKAQGHHLDRRRARHGALGQEPLHAGDPAGQRLPHCRGHPSAEGVSWSRSRRCGACSTRPISRWRSRTCVTTSTACCSKRTGRLLRTVATDGHRLSYCEATLEHEAGPAQQVIVPRKGVLELQRLLGGEGNVELAIGTNHVRAQIGDIRFTSKLIDGRFPEYSRVIPSNPTKRIMADREVLRSALQRAAILSNEKYRGIRLAVKPGALLLQSHNPEQEEAEEELEIDYAGEELEIGFNVNYLLDALAAVDGGEVEIGLTDANNSCLLSSGNTPQAKYVVMPMRL